METIDTTARESVFGANVPTDSVQDEIQASTRANGINSLFFFATAICGFDKVQKNPHLELCSFVQRIPKQRKVLLIPRDCYKSTLASKALPLWILLQPSFCGLQGREHRILLASFSSDNAKKQIKAIRHLVERNTLLQWLYPELIPDFTKTTWTDSNLLFPRDGVYGEDTIEAAGVDTHLVSRHYTVQIKDDLEDEKAMQSPTVRSKVYSWYKAAEALFVNEQSAFDLLVGTRWGIDDLYAQIKQNEGDTYEFLCRPLHWTREDLDDDIRQAREAKADSVYGMEPERFAPDNARTYYFFPTLFPEESCRRIRAKQGSFMYSMLYLNNPKDPSLAEFKDKDLRYFSFDTHGNIIIDHDDGHKEVVVFDSLKRVLFWDPAMSGPEQKRNDRNAMVCAAIDSEDRMFVLDALLERQNPTFLYHKFIGLHRRYQVHKAAIEDVAFQRVLKFPLYQVQREFNYRFPVIEQRPVGDKDTRIRSLIPRVEMHNLFIRKGLKSLVDELKGFPLFPTKDGVDALAACQELFGLKLPATERDIWRAARSDERKLASRDSVTGY
jgi:predicted phage terminase large subunit-like protein